MSNKIEKTNPDKIEKINPEVLKAAQRNKLTLKQTYFVDAYLRDRNGYKAAIKAYDIKTRDKKRLISVANNISMENLQKPLIKKTIIEVMESKELNLTDFNLLKKHVEIREKAIKVNQLSTAEKANKRFMEMKGMLEKKTETSQIINNITQVNINKLDEKEVNNKLLDIIKG